jgi:hypothetical protein
LEAEELMPLWYECRRCCRALCRETLSLAY